MKNGTTGYLNLQENQDIMWKTVEKIESSKLTPPPPPSPPSSPSEIAESLPAFFQKEKHGRRAAVRGASR